MTDFAAIAAQLVDVRNVGQHKSVRLTIHVPVEQAGAVMDAFGWPTMTDPVPVAIARLNPESEVMPNRSVNRTAPTNVQLRSNDKTPPDPEASQAPGRAKQSFRDLKPAQQAGILCNEPAFVQFLYERKRSLYDQTWGLSNESERAAECVRLFCGVSSRSDIGTDHAARVLWNGLVEEYRGWQVEASVVPA